MITKRFDQQRLSRFFKPLWYFNMTSNLQCSNPQSLSSASNIKNNCEELVGLQHMSIIAWFTIRDSSNCKGPVCNTDSFCSTNHVQTWVVGWGHGQSDKNIECRVYALNSSHGMRTFNGFLLCSSGSDTYYTHFVARQLVYEHLCNRYRTSFETRVSGCSTQQVACGLWLWSKDICAVDADWKGFREELFMIVLLPWLCVGTTVINIF